MSYQGILGLPIFRGIWSALLFVHTMFFKKTFDWRGATVSPEAIIEGGPENIMLGADTVVESGAVLSTTYGGKIRLGHGCVVRRGAMIMTYGGNIVLGDCCTVGPYSILYGHGGLKAGNYVLFAAHSIVITANHTFESLDCPIYEQPLSKQGVEIGNDVWIGASARVLDGVHIGDGAVVGAGAVVTKDLVPFSVNVGVPARLAKMRR